jgi:SAM-dependent methyltransferase
VPKPDAVKAFFDSPRYLERNAVLPVRARLVKELLAGVAGQRILDLGCGDGSVSRRMLDGGNQLTLVDFSPEMLRRARASAPPGVAIDFFESDILEFAPREQYDAVICVGVLAHVESVERTVAHIASLVRLGGLAIVQITDARSPLGWLLTRYALLRHPRRTDVNVTTRAGLVRIGNDHGLTELDGRRYGLALPGLGRIPRAWEARLEEVAASHRILSSLCAELLICFRKV